MLFILNQINGIIPQLSQTCNLARITCKLQHCHNSPFLSFIRTLDYLIIMNGFQGLEPKGEDGPREGTHSTTPQHHLILPERFKWSCSPSRCCLLLSPFPFLPPFSLSLPSLSPPPSRTASLPRAPQATTLGLSWARSSSFHLRVS